MNLLTIPIENFDGESIRQQIELRNIVLVKNLIQESLFSSLRAQLIQWRSSVPGENSKDHYPPNKRNLHIKVENNSENTADKTLEYYEDYTNLDVYNYRVGDMYDGDFNKQVSTFQPIGEKLLHHYNKVVQSPMIQHGQWKGHNLYFEIAHYHGDGGFIEKHTHLRNFNMGQRINMVTMMSQYGRDFKDSGLFFELDGKTIDTTLDFNEGDVIFFRMDTPHWVTPVKKSSHSNSTGRWTITTFYY